jgi:hypothetical protein
MLKIQKINKKVNIILNEIKSSDILIVQKRWIVTIFNITMHIVAYIYACSLRYIYIYIYMG